MLSGTIEMVCRCVGVHLARLGGINHVQHRSGDAVFTRRVCVEIASLNPDFTNSQRAYKSNCERQPHPKEAVHNSISGQKNVKNKAYKAFKLKKKEFLYYWK